MKANYEICVDGRVQGVGYRYFVMLKALELNLSGYVRNYPDGKVIVVAEGDTEDLELLVDFLRLGPPLARVRNVEVSRSLYTGSHEGFYIK